VALGSIDFAPAHLLEAALLPVDPDPALLAASTGAEAIILLGMEPDQVPLRGALRRIGSTLELVEGGAP